MNLRRTALGDDEPTSPTRHPGNDPRSVSSIGPSAGSVTATGATVQAPQTVDGMGRVYTRPYLQSSGKPSRE